MDESEEDLGLESLGVAVKNQGDVPFDLAHDYDLLVAKVEGKIGDDTIESIMFSEDAMTAYIKLKEPEGELLLHGNIFFIKYYDECLLHEQCTIWGDKYGEIF